MREIHREISFSFKGGQLRKQNPVNFNYLLKTKNNNNKQTVHAVRAITNFLVDAAKPSRFFLSS